MNTKQSKDGLKVYKFIGITFDENYKDGQEELNQAICQGYTIVRDYQTSAGIVFSLEMNEGGFSDESKQRSITEYLANTVQPQGGEITQ
jgi:hypothetical protein